MPRTMTRFSAMFFLGLLFLAVSGQASPTFASVEEGVLAYQQGNYDAALAAFEPAALAGDPEAQYGMGVLSYRGKGLDRDYVEAWKWFKLAADQGHEQAAQQLPAAEAKLLPEELEQARALAAAFQPTVEFTVEDAPTIDLDTNAIHPNAPEETVMTGDGPTIPGYPPLHGHGTATATENALPTTAPPEMDGNLPMAAPGVEPASEPADDADAATGNALPTTAPPEMDGNLPMAAPDPVAPEQEGAGDLGAALPVPGLGGVPGAAGSEPAPEPVSEPVVEPVPEPVADSTAATENALPTTAAPTASNLPFGAVEEAEYVFYYPQGFTPVDKPDVAHAYADPSGQAVLDVVVQEVGGAQGRLEFDLCRQLSGLMMADLMQKDMGGGGMGLGGMGGEEGPKIEVMPVKPPQLEDVGPDLQRCSFAFAHNADGPWKVIEQHLYYKLKVPKLYTVTMSMPQDSGQDEVMRPAFEAFQVR